MNTICTVVGQWQHASTDIDLEAQTVTGTHALVALPTLPPSARSAAAPTRTPVHDRAMSHSESDPVDDFFGVTRPRATHESRHDSGSELPAYDVAPREPPTLAMYLFKFGFLFPPFWIMGAIILLSPLKAPADFEPSKSDAERQELVQLIRSTELKWAKRSAWALLAFIVSLGVICGIVAAVVKNSS
ncbi:hypothetical protein SCLCIDRAFT_114255 [Scleroderma citrinum Foug A]|uniref:Transmembrane protein n=1 Tax=Scleroderma citrinum Foug A TaxID=1036808 RepID=A0A0C3EAA0_9AGAM|nr:hypothetical protein SCLCIDRAFT_114255 [Scleroderma citrinum Foug A]